MWKFLAYICFLGALAGGAAWYSYRDGAATWSAVPAEPDAPDYAWLDDLYSGNPREAEKATREVRSRGADALPALRETLSDPSADRDRRRAALKACTILGQTAAPAVPEVADQLRDPELTAEAALALSFMGPDAFPPLGEALDDDDPMVRAEALRSIGKLRSRAPLEVRLVLPPLIDGMRDPDPGVRAVAATYLGIIQEEPRRSVPALVDGLRDPEAEVRVASATALGSFGPAARGAIPALRKAVADSDADVAREAGRAIIRVQPHR